MTYFTNFIDTFELEAHKIRMIKPISTYDMNNGGYNNELPTGNMTNLLYVLPVLPTITYPIRTRYIKGKIYPRGVEKMSLLFTDIDGNFIAIISNDGLLFINKKIYKTDYDSNISLEAIHPQLINILHQIVQFWLKLYDYIYEENMDTNIDLSDKLVVGLLHNPNYPETVKSFCRSIFGGNTTLMRDSIHNKNELFKSSMMEMMVNFESKMKKLKQEMVDNFVNKLQIFIKAGYIYDLQHHCLTKDVDIVPTVCMYKDQYYYLSPKHLEQSYHISRIYCNITDLVTDRFVLRAEATHPNISNHICIGNENEALASAVFRGGNFSKLKQLLDDVEVTLHTINFDSAFRDSYVDYTKHPELRIYNKDSLDGLFIPTNTEPEKIGVVV